MEQVAQLSQRDRTAEWVSYGQKWKSGTGKQYLRTSYVGPNWPAKQPKSMKKRKIRVITPFDVIQGYQARYRVSIEISYATFY